MVIAYNCIIFEDGEIDTNVIVWEEIRLPHEKIDKAIKLAKRVLYDSMNDEATKCALKAEKLGAHIDPVTVCHNDDNETTVIARNTYEICPRMMKRLSKDTDDTLMLRSLINTAVKLMQHGRITGGRCIIYQEHEYKMVYATSELIPSIEMIYRAQVSIDMADVLQAIEDRLFTLGCSICYARYNVDKSSKFRIASIQGQIGEKLSIEIDKAIRKAIAEVIGGETGIVLTGIKEI